MSDKCTRFDFCETLQKSLSDTHSGIYVNVLFSMTKGRETGLVATLYSGEYKKRGVSMMFCPFCGKKLGRLPTSEMRRARRETVTA